MNVDEVSFDIKLELEVSGFRPLRRARQEVRKVYLEERNYFHAEYISSGSINSARGSSVHIKYSAISSLGINVGKRDQ